MPNHCRAWPAVALLAAAPTFATELVYQPVNPAFGGNPLNGSVLLNNAQAQNRTKDPDSPSSGPKSALQQFNDTLQRSILSQLASAATSKVIGADGQLIPGTVETGDFRITVVDTGDGMLTITTVDKTTGATSSFQVSK